jgi:hypothetical protein
MSELANIKERVEKVRVIAAPDTFPIVQSMRNDIRYLLAKVEDQDREILRLRGFDFPGAA